VRREEPRLERGAAGTPARSEERYHFLTVQGFRETRRASRLFVLSRGCACSR
jgi:hypothetical protein